MVGGAERDAWENGQPLTEGHHHNRYSQANEKIDPEGALILTKKPDQQPQTSKKKKKERKMEGKGP